MDNQYQGDFFDFSNLPEALLAECEQQALREVAMEENRRRRERRDEKNLPQGPVPPSPEYYRSTADKLTPFEKWQQEQQWLSEEQQRSPEPEGLPLLNPFCYEERQFLFRRLNQLVREYHEGPCCLNDVKGDKGARLRGIAWRAATRAAAVLSAALEEIDRGLDEADADLWAEQMDLATAAMQEAAEAEAESEIPETTELETFEPIDLGF